MSRTSRLSIWRGIKRKGFERKTSESIHLLKVNPIFLQHVWTDTPHLFKTRILIFTETLICCQIVEFQFYKTYIYSFYSPLDPNTRYMVLSYLRNETYHPELYINLNFERDPNYLAHGSSIRLLVQYGDLISYVKDDTGLVVKTPSMCHVYKAQASITDLALSERFVAIKSGNYILILKICENTDIVCSWLVLMT